MALISGPRKTAKAALAEGVDKHGTGAISAYLSAAPAKNIGIPYTNPKPDTCNPSVSWPRYCTKDSMVINKPSAITKFPKENPRISNGGSPALLTPAPPIMADFGASQPYEKKRSHDKMRTTNHTSSAFFDLNDELYTFQPSYTHAVIISHWKTNQIPSSVR